MKKIPVTIVTGALGSGKTTLINHILTSAHGLRVGVIVNEFGDVGIDSELIISSEDEELIELTNGCMCCTVRGDLIDSIQQLIDTKKIDYIVIETSGLSEVLPAIFIFEAPIMQKTTNLDSIITVVDALNFLEYLKEHKSAREQVEVADFVLLNKSDKVHTSDLKICKQKIQELVPKAKIIETVRCDIDVRLLLGVGKFSFDGLKEFDEKSHSHDPNITAVSITTGPVDSDKVQAVLDNLPDSIYRAKGIVCIKASVPGKKDELRIAFHKVGKFAELEFVRGWAQGEKRKTTIVFIGKKINKKELQKKLDACK